MKRLIPILLCAALLCACAAVPAETRAPETTVPQTTAPAVDRQLYVLMYHSVAPDGTECNAWTVPESTFRAHMQYIAARGYTVVAPSDLASGEPLPEKGVMITFDDGYADNFTAALPILEDYGYKAVVALITSCMETSDGGFWMSWDMCRQAAEGGILELGVHTHATHKYPGIQRREGESREEYRERLAADLDTAIALIREKAGVTPIYFAYPQGIKDEWATDLIDGRFLVTGTSDVGVNDPDEGTHDLMRYNVGEATDISLILP